MYQPGPPPRNDSGMPPGGLAGSHFPQPGYAGSYQGGVPPPPMVHQPSVGPNDNTYAARAERYTPPPPPPAAMSRPMSQYHPEGGQPRPGRMSTAYGHTPNSSRTYDRHKKNHYGHLVNDASAGATPCGGTAWKGCCKYNTLGCLFCFNGCMRLCGCGVSLMETLHLD
ncbi:hypothetical protein LPJ61_004718 [Coemansia biformis]|uniref:Uncharacterized protein n=1 Tax=Coemansia biformis TaxID=1286918 RepID=A0A9W7Y9Q1_9FUNG|nr:hypothetical protein LPJ61_004718 [Coemansia biformis]